MSNETPKKSINPKMQAHKFQKGQIPWNKGMKKAKPEASKDRATCPEKDKESENVVKIHVVRDEPQREKQRDFKYDKEAYNERVCTRFLNSIVANRPLKIEIENQTYYSTAFVGNIIKVSRDLAARQNEKYDALCKRYDELQAEADSMCKTSEELVASSAECIRNGLKDLRRMRLWRGIAIGLAAVYIVFGLAELIARAKCPTIPPTPPAAVAVAD